MNQSIIKSMKNPTLKEKVAKYEEFFHKINAFLMSGAHEGIAELINNADMFSYMHRVGNGELSDKEQQKLINGAFWGLCDTPKADVAIKERQKAWTEAQKQKEQAFLKAR